MKADKFCYIQSSNESQNLCFNLQEGESLQLTFIVLGDVKVNNHIVINLDGKNAACSLRGLWLINGDADVNFDVKMNHHVANCTSDQLFKGIANDRAKSNFYGLINVSTDAQKSDARQQCHNLLLSDDARAYAKPQLEIYADDVICTHGATVGRLNDDELFYMRSRGISLDEAKKIQLKVFAAAPLDFVTKDTASHLEDWINAISL